MADNRQPHQSKSVCSANRCCIAHKYNLSINIYLLTLLCRLLSSISVSSGFNFLFFFISMFLCLCVMLMHVSHWVSVSLSPKTHIIVACIIFSFLLYCIVNGISPYSAAVVWSSMFMWRRCCCRPMPGVVAHIAHNASALSRSKNSIARPPFMISSAAVVRRIANSSRCSFSVFTKSEAMHRMQLFTNPAPASVTRYYTAATMPQCQQCEEEKTKQCRQTRCHKSHGKSLTLPSVDCISEVKPNTVSVLDKQIHDNVECKELYAFRPWLM